jgi:hypothetical protein
MAVVENSLLIAMNCKDEMNIREWVLFHSIMGMTKDDCLLIFDDMSETPVEEILHTKHWEWRSDIQPHVEIVRLHEGKHVYINRAIEFAKERGVMWMMYIDADEYLYIPLQFDHNIKKFLKETVLQAAPMMVHGIAFFWRYFGSCHLEENPFPGQCISVYHKCSRSISLKQKTMIRVERAAYCMSPHHYAFDRSKLNGTENGHLLYVPLLGYTIPNVAQLRAPEHKSLIYDLQSNLAVRPGGEFLAHYSNQSWKCFCRRRRRPRDDTGEIRSYSYSIQEGAPSTETFHTQHNDMDCDSVLRMFFHNIQRMFQIIDPLINAPLQSFNDLIMKTKEKRVLHKLHKHGGEGIGKLEFEGIEGSFGSEETVAGGIEGGDLHGSVELSECVEGQEVEKAVEGVGH